MTNLPFNSDDQECELQIRHIQDKSEGSYQYKTIFVVDASGKIYTFDVNQHVIEQYLLSHGCSSILESEEIAANLWHDRQILQNYANFITPRMMVKCKERPGPVKDYSVALSQAKTMLIDLDKLDLKYFYSEVHSYDVQKHPLDDNGIMGKISKAMQELRIDIIELEARLLAEREVA